MTHHNRQNDFSEKKGFSSEMKFSDSLFVVEIVKGLGITLRHFLKNLLNRQKFLTISYPEERRQYGPLFRGRHKINLRDDGTPMCVACMMCATVCPARCITIVAEESPNTQVEKRPKSFTIDGLRCVMCGFCVDACPVGAIYMTGEYEMADYTREACVWDVEFLTKRPSLQKAPPGYEPLV
jgi:NADH-quinone oxidoreductase subunit I